VHIIPLQARDQSDYLMLLINPEHQMAKCRYLVYLPLQQGNLHYTPEASSEGLHTHAATLYLHYVNFPFFAFPSGGFSEYHENNWIFKLLGHHRT